MIRRTWARCGGEYRYGDWTITRIEVNRTPGYVWFAFHPDNGEFEARTLAEAKAVALAARKED